MNYKDIRTISDNDQIKTVRLGLNTDTKARFLFFNKNVTVVSRILNIRLLSLQM